MVKIGHDWNEEDGGGDDGEADEITGILIQKSKKFTGRVNESSGQINSEEEKTAKKGSTISSGKRPKSP